MTTAWTPRDDGIETQTHMNIIETNNSETKYKSIKRLNGAVASCTVTSRYIADCAFNLSLMQLHICASFIICNAMVDRLANAPVTKHRSEFIYGCKTFFTGMLSAQVSAVASQHEANLCASWCVSW